VIESVGSACFFDGHAFAPRAVAAFGVEFSIESRVASEVSLSRRSSPIFADATDTRIDIAGASRPRCAKATSQWRISPSSAKCHLLSVPRIIPHELGRSDL